MARLLRFAWTFIHCTDVGGYAPGSIDMRNNEVFQEGLRLRPVKLMRGGVLNEELWTIFADNCRIPGLNWGDMTACLAALDKAEERLTRLAERYGRGAVDQAIYADAGSHGAVRAAGAGADSGRTLQLRRVFRG